LYLKKGWSLRRISEELGCSEATVRKKLIEAEIVINEHVGNDYKTLKKNIQAMRGRGLSFQAIADAFNLWMILTRTGHGQ
jgi:biotin operon repressor